MAMRCLLLRFNFVTSDPGSALGNKVHLPSQTFLAGIITFVPVSALV